MGLMSVDGRVFKEGGRDLGLGSAAYGQRASGIFEWKSKR